MQGFPHPWWTVVVLIGIYDIQHFETGNATNKCSWASFRDLSQSDDNKCRGVGRNCFVLEGQALESLQIGGLDEMEEVMPLEISKRMLCRFFHCSSPLHYRTQLPEIITRHVFLMNLMVDQKSFSVLLAKYLQQRLHQMKNLSQANVLQSPGIFSSTFICPVYDHKKSMFN